MNHPAALVDRATRLAIKADQLYLARRDAHNARYLARRARRLDRAAWRALERRQP